VAWQEQAVARHHDRAGFDCGVPALNEFLGRYARQSQESGGARTFVAVSPGAPSTVLGYYAISPGAIAFAKTPAKITKALGRCEVPVFRLGRLAVSLDMQGWGLGADLLFAAGERALAVAQEVGGVALAIDAKDERAACWYERFGAVRLVDDPLKLVLPLETIRTAI
jgi:GNAT superfamily N-acetyltransferase